MVTPDGAEHRKREPCFCRPAGQRPGELMKRKAMCTIACCFLGSTLVLSGTAVAQQRAGGAFPQPTPEKQVTVTELPGVIPAGAQCNLVWQGPPNAHGLLAPTHAPLLS